MKRYKNYIFDLYGTLVDIWTDEEDTALWKWLAAEYSRRGAKYGPEEIKEGYHSLVKRLEAELSERTGAAFPEIRIEDVFDGLFSAKGIPAGAWPAESIAREFRARSTIKLKLYPDTVRVLKELKKRGCSLHLLSNAQKAFTVPELEALGAGGEERGSILGLMDSVYISSDCGVKKPQPEFMQRLLSEQGLEPKSCVMVGNDFSTDVEVAALCGMDAVFINTFGYSAERIEKENVRGAALAESLSELLSS